MFETRPERETIIKCDENKFKSAIFTPHLYRKQKYNYIYLQTKV